MRGLWSASLLHLLRPFYILSWLETMKIWSLTVLQKEILEENLNWNWTQAVTVAGTPGTRTEPLKSSMCGQLSLLDPAFICVWDDMKQYCRLMGQLVQGCPKWTMAFLMYPEEAKPRDWFLCFSLSCKEKECETVEDGDSHTIACIPQTLEWFYRWLWHYWKYGLVWPLRRKGKVLFPSFQEVCMVAKRLKKIQALAKVQKISLQSLQLVLPVREIYSGTRSWSADMDSSRYSYWVYFIESGRLMTAHQKAGEARSQSLNVQVSTARSTWALEAQTLASCATPRWDA